MRNYWREIYDLTERFPNAEDKQAVLNEIMHLVNLLSENNDDSRSKDSDLAVVIANLSPHLGGEFLRKVLDSALQISHPRSQVLALISLINRSPHITSDQREIALSAALKAAFAIEHDFWRIDAMLFILNRLCFDKNESYPVIVQQTLDMAFAIEDVADRAKSLAVLSNHIPDDHRKQFLQNALDMASNVTDESKREDALKFLSFYL